MSFFKNVNIDIKEIPAGSKVKVGDVGKTTYVHTDTLNYKTTTYESPQVKPDEVIAICIKLNAYPQFGENGIYIQKLRDAYEDIPLRYLSPLNSADIIPYGQLTKKTTFDMRKDKYERIYEVENILNHPDASHLKRLGTIARHACRDCAFYGRCLDAPSCITRYIKKMSSNDRTLIEDAVYFKYDKKNDKLIDSTTSPHVNSNTTYITRDEWNSWPDLMSNSLSTYQHNNH